MQIVSLDALRNFKNKIEEKNIVDITSNGTGNAITSAEIKNKSNDTGKTIEVSKGTFYNEIKVEGSGVLTDVSADGGKLTFTASPASTGIIDYSEDEQDTGRKWINGKKVYSKTVIGKNKQIEYENKEYQFYQSLNNKVPSFCLLNGVLYTTNQNGLRMSTDDGETWESLRKKIEKPVDIYDIEYFDVLECILFDGYLYANVYATVKVNESDNTNKTREYLVRCKNPQTDDFEIVDKEFYSHLSMSSFIVFDNCLYIATSSFALNKIFYLTSSDTELMKSYTDPSNSDNYVNYFYKTETNLYAITSKNEILYLKDNAINGWGSLGYLNDDYQNGSYPSDIRDYSKDKIILFKNKLFLKAYKNSDVAKEIIYFKGNERLPGAEMSPLEKKTITYTENFGPATAYRTGFSFYTTQNVIYAFPEIASVAYFIYSFDGDNWKLQFNNEFHKFYFRGFYSIADEHYAVFLETDEIFEKDYYYIYKIQENPEQEEVEINQVKSFGREKPNNKFEYSTFTYSTFTYEKEYANSEYTETYKLVHTILNDKYFNFSLKQFTPNNHISTIPGFEHLVKCDRIENNAPSEIPVSINPSTGNVDIGNPVRDYEHLNGVQLYLEYTKTE